MIPRQRSVRFYENDVFLTEAVASRIKLGLQVTDTLIAMVPASHHTDLRKVLTADEFANPHLMFIDTTSLLTRVMGDDWPNQSMLIKVFGNRIQKACQNLRVRVLGEMVALHWALAKYRAAFRLEEWQNTLQTTHSFSHLHANPRSALISKEDPQSLLAVHHDTHVHRQKTDTSAPGNRHIVAAVVSLPSSLYIGTPRLLLCFARVTREQDVPPRS
ncbi:MAG TPA: hypothetical protein VLM19_02580 [Nitrospiraceae bacterium]|nr:hypothetical protein [Nitrospiraceae bacterium]